MTRYSFFHHHITRRVAGTAAFYAVAFLLINILQERDPGGPCAPGTGMLLFLLLIPTSLVLFSITLYNSAKKDRSYLYAALVHVLVWTVVSLFMS